MFGDTRLALVIATALLWVPAGCGNGDRNVRSRDTAEGVEIVEESWPDGKLRLRKQVLRNADGTLVDHGTYTRWHPNGQKAYEATFVAGKVHGIETQWHKNGQKSTEQHYDHGMRHGPRITWDENGQKRKEEHFVNDKPHGTWTVWGKDGRIKAQNRFDHGTPKS